MGAPRLFAKIDEAAAQDAAFVRSTEGTSTGLRFRRGPEAAAFFLFALAVYLCLALASVQVHPYDPTVTGEDWVGPVGAILAKALARGIGLMAWALPLEMALLAWPLLRRRELKLTGLRVAGDLVIGIVGAAALHVAAPKYVVFGKIMVGGNVGLLFGELLQALFSTIGTFVVSLTILGLVLIGRSSFSFIRSCERAWESAVGLSMFLSETGKRLLSTWNAASRLLPAGPTLDDDMTRQSRKVLLTPSPAEVAESLKSAWVNLTPTSNEDCGEETPSAEQPRVEALETEGPTTGVETLASTTSVTHLLPLPIKNIRLPVTVALGKRAKTRRKGKSPALSELDRPLEGDADPGSLLEEVASDATEKVESLLPTPDATRSDGAESDASLRIVDTREEVQAAPVAPEQKNLPQRGKFLLPSTELLEPPQAEVVNVDKERVVELAERLEKTLSDYGVLGKVEEVHPGPTVTTYEFKPQAGTKVSKVAGLSDDLALGLSRKVRIIAPIPGKARIGFEIPNDERVPVNLRELVEDGRFAELAKKAALPVVLGRDIVGSPTYADLAGMPHVIVAGATGAGKSVGLNVMLSSVLFKRSPDELRLLMIDPKVVELAPFDGIPHMLLPVVTDMKQAAKALKWAVDEMEKRYKAFATAGTKNITTYNRWVDRIQQGEIPAPPAQEVEALTADGCAISVPAAKAGSDGTQLPGRMPHIVIVVDEFADLMMQQGKEVEASVARLAQKARAAGMHVVLATQRPSVDVITGMIKANFPTRIAYRVAQKVDSRTILDEMGAELLLGRGDLLVKLNGSTETNRVQCPFVSEEEVEELTAYLRTQGTPVYHEDILKGGDDEEAPQDSDEKLDVRYDEAVRIVADTQRCSTSWIQRKMTIGYNRAAKIVEAMEARGVIGPANGAKDREIFVHPQ